MKYQIDLYFKIYNPNLSIFFLVEMYVIGPKN